MSDVFEEVKKVICDQLDVEASQVVAEARFVEDLGADSLDTVELVMAFEETFDFEIPDEQAEQIKSVQDVLDLIAAKEAG